MRCPSCGIEIDADQRFAKLVVCASCGSSVVLDEKAVRLSGKMAVLAQTPSPLQVGATGRLGKRSFQVLGRVRYGYARGYWDEWFIRLEDDKTAWISEDESNFTIEAHEGLDAPPADFATVRPGDTLTIAGQNYHVDEKDVATCEGGEGQLPFVIEQDERVPFLDLTGEKTFATLEYEIDGSGSRLFHGRRIDSKDLEIDLSSARGGAGLAAEREADGANRERVVRQDDRSKSLNCNCCGAPLQVSTGASGSVECEHCGTEVELNTRRTECGACGATIPLYGFQGAKSFICPQCRTQSDVTRREPNLLDVVVQENRPPVPFRMGQRGKILGYDFVLVGHIRTHERDEGKTYVADEFLLFNKQLGYRWLVMEDGHFSLTEELDDRPENIKPQHIAPGRNVAFRNQVWRVFGRGRCEIVWVDGELPWVAQVGDKSHYLDVTRPPHLLSAEWTQSEQEWYLGQYIRREDIAAGFGIPARDLPRQRGIAPHQEFKRSPFRSQAMAVMGISACIFAVLGFNAWRIPGKQIASFEIAPAEYAEEFITEPFEVTGENRLYRAEFKAPVDNSWVYMQVAMLNEADEALFDFSGEMSFYHGVEGREKWKEGSREDSAVFKLNKPGNYKLLVLGQAGRGDDTSVNATAHGVPVKLVIKEGVQLARYYIIVAVLCLLWLGVEVVTRSSFEHRKWAESDVEDD